MEIEPPACDWMQSAGPDIHSHVGREKRRRCCLPCRRWRSCQTDLPPEACVYVFTSLRADPELHSQAEAAAGGGRDAVQAVQTHSLERPEGALLHGYGCVTKR